MKSLKNLKYISDRYTFLCWSNKELLIVAAKLPASTDKLKHYWACSYINYLHAYKKLKNI